MSGESCFYLMAMGQIEGCKISGHDQIYCKYTTNFGADWQCIKGVQTGISQTSCKNPSDKYPFLFNYPFSLSFKAWNPTGWPHLIIAVYGVASDDKHVIAGYASIRMPVFPGRHVVEAELFRPIASNWFTEFVSHFTGRAEYHDTNFITESKKREVTRVTSNGSIKVVFNIMTRNLKSFGYSVND
eukprot:CAMPEP_0202697626 /NCGR_PEP_ID=MMETSP1385-20130828/10946_1 /ASSEMBLY_ACC=CAM_ASM_000861 /TAXON_ID=933848 /ORGANISM="Elphidium margaritaceum" /LENGTH=184 /DNA_ID=CAMNT_0049354127 /DNA_START=39 /DNA_END=593 /DNA_ORIENTATION=-